MKKNLALVAVLAVVQLAIVGVAVAPRLSAHLRGEEYRLRVAPVDPIDPFRGAYVDLGYGIQGGFPQDGETDVWVPLTGREPHSMGRPTTRRPDGPAVRCRRDEGGAKCGIESFFASEDEARRLERVLAGGAVARIKIDGAGRAALLGLE